MSEQYIRLRQVSRDYPTAVVRGALIRHWASANHIGLSSIERTDHASKYIYCSDPDDLIAAEKHVGTLLNHISIKDLEGCFGALIDSSHKRSRGAVLTPNFIIDYLVEVGLAFGWKTRNRLPNICDPSCGYGGFLIREAKILFEKYGVELETSFRECLTGIDCDKESLEHAAILIELFLLSRGVNPKGIPFRLLHSDSLCDEGLLQKTGARDGFDLVATNPPYVKLQNLEPPYRTKLIEKYPQYTRGSFSTALLFLVVGHQLLTNTGCLAFITQNNLYTSLSGTGVRRYLQQSQCIRRIVDFGHNRVFPNASAYTCLIFLGSTPVSSFEFARIDKGPNAGRLWDCTFSSIRHAQLHPSKWRLAKSHHLDNLQRIESAGSALGQGFSIKVGFATLKDQVYFTEEHEGKVFATLADGRRIEIEAEVTKGMTKIPEIGTEADFESNRRRIIFPYEKIGKKHTPLSEARLRRQFPLCYEYLLHWREALESRDKGKGAISPWFAWGRTQAMEAPGPKLLTKTFSDRPQFVLDKSDRLFCNGYGIFPRPRSESGSLFGSIPILALQRILNSAIMDYYAKLTSFQIGGNYQCYQKNFIERFGLCELEPKQVDEVLSMPETDIDEYLAEIYGIALHDICEVVIKQC